MQTINVGVNGERERGSFNLTSRLVAHRGQEKKLTWTGTFLEYYDLVSKNPLIARLSHARIYDMVMAAGVGEVGADRPKIHNFFSSELFGIDKPIEQLVGYFSSAARRLEVRKRILLLMGPVGGGKSTLVSMIKRGLEVYSQTDGGAVYAIEGCPMHEEPLHLLPEQLRGEVMNELGVYIEGDLCPHCRLKVEENKGRIEDISVVRFTFSEKQRRGIGTFSPSDPKSQDISELTGSINLATIGEYGAESDPRAYRFDGELNVSNRGLMEFIEMLKCDERFLYSLLTLSQEQNIKTGRFAMIYADEAIMSHTNENEYNAFIDNKRSEALQDRIIIVRVPYNLQLREEVKIYRKMVAQGTNVAIGRLPGGGEIHVAPETLEVVSLFAVASRLVKPKKEGMTLMKKLKLYDDEPVEGFTEKDLKDLQEEGAKEREGMDGVSPRYVVNALSSAIVKESSKSCINPIDAMRALRDNLEHHAGYSAEEREKYLGIIGQVREEYDERAKREVQKAFVYSFEESATTLLNSYLDNVEAFLNKTRLKDPITGEELEPDEKLMRSLEEQIGVTQAQSKAFREEVLIRLSSLGRRGQKLEYTSHSRLREAIEKKLFADLKDIVKITTATKTPDADQLKRVNEVTTRLMGEHGYCVSCSQELLRYVGALLHREK